MALNPSVGYVLHQHVMRLSRPTLAYDAWARRVPAQYRRCILGDAATGEAMDPESDPNCLARLRHYRSLIAMAMEARKPVFHLRSADGALGAHAAAVTDARREWRRLATKILEKTAGEAAPCP